MKTYILPLAAAAICSIVAAVLYARQSSAHVPSGDGDGHVLTSQWNEYEKAVQADRPKKMLQALNEIKAEAIRRHLPIDFYDAATLCVERGRQLNWKDYDSLRNNLSKEVQAFDEPIVTFIWGEAYGGVGITNQLKFVKEQSARLQHARTTHLWSHYDGAVSNYSYFVTNDYEFALWRLLSRGWFSGDHPEDDETYKTLKDYLKDGYPGAARLAYYVASHRTLKVNKLRDMRHLAEQYQGKAFALFPREDLLMAEFDSLNNAKADEKAYRALYEKCRAYEKEKKSYSGDEKKLVEHLSGVENLAGTLNEERIGVKVKNDTVILYFRNVGKATLTLYQLKEDGTQGKALKKWEVTNKTNSFYVIDHERIAVPVLDDGNYRFEMVSGKLMEIASYSSHTLSLALRRDADTYRFYAADYVTGKPLEAFKLILCKGGSQISEKTVTQYGFTPLPEEMEKKMDKYASYTVKASYKDAQGRLRLSPEVSLYNSKPYFGDDSYSKSVHCNIYKDKGAYNPDDVMHFKAVLYKGDLRSDLSTLPAGEEVKVSLKNASDKEIATQTLKTTEFGSVSGEFVLERGERNGYYTLDINYKDKNITSTSFRVDDFILPTFTVRLEREDKLVTPGDSVRIKGHVETFSGHALTAAKVKADISKYVNGKNLVIPVETAPDEEGNFEISFLASDAGGYGVDVTVTDATGESASAWTRVVVVSSFSINSQLLNKSNATLFLIGDEKIRYTRFVWREPARESPAVIYDDSLKVRLAARNSDGDEFPIDIQWKLTREEDGNVMASGTNPSREAFTLDLSKYPSGLYSLSLKASAKSHNGESMNADSKSRFLLIRPSDNKMNAPVRRVFIPGKTLMEAGENITVRFGSNDGPVWAVATLYGLNGKILDNQVLNFKSGALTDISFLYKASYPDAVRLKIFYFKYGEEITYDRVFRKARHSLDMPLSFSVFHDKTSPSTEYTFKLKAIPGAEAVAAVYDKSLDAIAYNTWSVVKASDLTISSVSINSAGGRVSGGDPYRFTPDYHAEEEKDEGFPVNEFAAEMYDEAPVMYRSKASSKAVGGAAVLMAPMEQNAVMRSAVAEEDAGAPAEATAEEVAAAADVTIREVFADALTFQPHLKSNEEGEIAFTFSTSDKLSTYYVSVYAHDKAMHNGLAVQEMKVSVPVKVQVAEPKYLYETDSWKLSATVSCNTDHPVSGKLMLFVYPGTDHQHLEAVSALVREVTVPKGGQIGADFDVKPCGESEMGVKVVFVAQDEGQDFSDAVFVPIEVKQARQTLTEAHSAVWLSGADKEALKANLRSRFVNVPASEAEYNEISILDMVKEALPDKAEPDGKDVVSLSEAYYVQLVASSLLKQDLPEGNAELLKKILACRNQDGGFAWFEGMKSSRVLTAVLLERFAALRDSGFEVPDLTSSVKYLDAGQLLDEYPYWCGWLSDSQYLYVRSMYASVPFEYSPSGKSAVKRFAEFKKETKDYLVPSKKAGRGLEGYILGKARRIKTLRNLLDSKEGIDLAKALGVRLSAKQKMDKSMVADLLSLVEYSVKHPDGGYYYPNAVMPFRGLLESEAYAHSLLCDLLTSVGMEKNAEIRSETGDDAGVIADGIRLWLMLQKETQKWDEDPAFVNAIRSILDGSDEVLATQVLIYKATYTKPFTEIQAAGNGFTVARHFFREEKESTKLEPIQPGTILSVGDRIVVKYAIWNKENRSFVKLVAPREASLRPVNQLSGHVGWWMRPLVAGWYSFSPQGYRNVLIDRTEYYFDSYPEENTTLTEEFYVTQAGSFSAPVVTIESLYAPHYRANDGFGGELVSTSSSL